MELKWLYTSIPNSEEIVSVKENYDHYPRKPKPAKIIRTLLALILTRSNFLFNAKFYFKIKSCAMGTIRILSNSNIFMSEFEKKYVYPLIKNNSVTYLRYIDDIFMVWIKSKSVVRQFMIGIYQKPQTIKFDIKFSKESIEFHISAH